MLIDKDAISFRENMLQQSADRLKMEINHVIRALRKPKKCLTNCFSLLDEAVKDSRFQVRDVSFPRPFLSALSDCELHYADHDALNRAMADWRSMMAFAKQLLITTVANSSAPFDDIGGVYCGIAQELQLAIYALFTSDPPSPQVIQESGYGRLRVNLQEWLSEMLMGGKICQVPLNIGKALFDIVTKGNPLQASASVLHRFDRALGAFVGLQLKHTGIDWTTSENEAIKRYVSVLKLNALIVVTPTPTVL